MPEKRERSRARRVHEGLKQAGRRAPDPAPAQDALPLDVADTRPPPREEWVRGLIRKEET